MTRLIYGASRAAQLLGLLALPSAIWAAEVRHSERETVVIFFASIAVFSAGTLVTRLVSQSGK